VGRFISPNTLSNILAQWSSPFLGQRPKHKIISLALHNYNFATAMNHNVNVCYVISVGGHHPLVENQWFRSSDGFNLMGSPPKLLKVEFLSKLTCQGITVGLWVVFVCLFVCLFLLFSFSFFFFVFWSNLSGQEKLGLYVQNAERNQEKKRSPILKKLVFRQATYWKQRTMFRDK